ncbi:alpha/beta hydrolase [Chelatococcus reniformis]|uniref:Lipoprotein n=1 Tax=Chelatococcus reniformis TaxID=1494448 RepID=A0A916ULY6_9HYPH|nr:alpha/beta hydrolase [Chelatococcus reniformis]GGC76950.1 lipoprotein [Chelatococcus reniformis]
MSLRTVQWALAASLLAGVGGCARPEGALAPVLAAPGAGAKVEMLAATTRAPSDRPGVVFGGERGDGLAFADIVVSVPPNRQVGSIQWPRRGPADPARTFAVTSLSDVPRAGVRSWLKKEARGRRRALIFVHGFNTRFDAAVFRFAQLIHDSNAGLVPILFSWPSRGRVLDYVYDRESTNFSRSDLVELMNTVAASPEVDEVVIMAHSMGAWLTVEALRQEALRRGRIPAKITDVILASPDLDVDVFERQVAEMGPKRPHITIFVSRNDRALGLARLIAGRVTRVGAVDLTDAAYRDRLDAAAGVVVVDLTGLSSGDPLNHSKFATSPAVVQVLGEQLLRRQPGDDSSNRAADVAQTLGAALGSAVAAPILVFSGGQN